MRSQVLYRAAQHLSQYVLFSYVISLLMFELWHVVFTRHIFPCQIYFLLSSCGIPISPLLSKLCLHVISVLFSDLASCFWYSLFGCYIQSLEGACMYNLAPFANNIASHCKIMAYDCIKTKPMSPMKFAAAALSAPHLWSLKSCGRWGRWVQRRQCRTTFGWALPLSCQRHPICVRHVKVCVNGTQFVSDMSRYRPTGA